MLQAIPVDDVDACSPRTQNCSHPMLVTSTEDRVEICRHRLQGDQQLFLSDDPPRYLLVMAGAGSCCPTSDDGPRAGTSPSTSLPRLTAKTTRPLASWLLRRAVVRRRLAARRGRRHRAGPSSPRIGQARGRRQQGPARGPAALDRDDRQRGDRAARAATASRWRAIPELATELDHAVACGSCTGSCSCSTPRRGRSWACCRSAHPSTTPGYGLDRLRELIQRPLTDAQPATAPTCTSRCGCCSGWSTTDHGDSGLTEDGRRA